MFLQWWYNGRVCVGQHLIHNPRPAEPGESAATSDAPTECRHATADAATPPHATAPATPDGESIFGG